MDVVNSWVRGIKAKGYAMSTDGQNLMSWNKIIGRTLQDGTKQVLNLHGVYNVSSSTAKHVTYAMRGKNVQSIEPMAVFPNMLYAVNIDFKRMYAYLDFSKDTNTFYTIRLTKQVWKTLKGAQNAANKLNNKRVWIFPLDDNKSFSLFSPYYIDNFGKPE
jgi:hypothetical protein